MAKVAKMDNATVHCEADLRIETAEYRERGDDLLSSPVICPELQIDSDFTLSSREAVENLHSMFTRTAAEVTKTTCLTVKRMLCLVRKQTTLLIACRHPLVTLMSHPITSTCASMQYPR